MAFAIPDTGESQALQYLTNKAVSENLMLRLFTNAIVPGEADVLASYQEANYTGYLPIVLVGANWNAPALGEPTIITYPQQTFQCTGVGVPQSMMGYFLTGAISNALIGAETFTLPVRMVAPGDKVKITPSIGAF